MIRKLHSFFFQGTFFITTLKVRKTGWQHDILLSKFPSNMYFSPGRCHINFVWHYVNPCKYYRKLVECRNGGFSRLLVATSFPISFRSCKGIQIPESVKFLLVESGILLRIGIQNPSSTDKESGIQYLESGIHGEEGHEKLARIFGCIDKPISASFRFILGLEASESWVALRSRMNNTFLLFYFPNFRLHNR